MKTYGGRRGIAPLILDLGARLDVGAQLHVPAASSLGNKPGTH
jgi:hypothetical protein